MRFWAEKTCQFGFSKGEQLCWCYKDVVSVPYQLHDQDWSHSTHRLPCDSHPHLSHLHVRPRTYRISVIKLYVGNYLTIVHAIVLRHRSIQDNERWYVSLSCQSQIACRRKSPNSEACVFLNEFGIVLRTTHRVFWSRRVLLEDYWPELFIQL